jgi:hypothetical protein
LLCAVIGIGGIGAVWATARMIAGSRAGLLAAAALSACGIWYGTMFAHTKDIPFAAAMMAALYVLLRLTRDLPKPRWHLVLLFGVLLGCALGIRVLGLFAIGYAGLAVMAYAPIGSVRDWRGALTFVVRSGLALLPAFALAHVRASLCQHQADASAPRRCRPRTDPNHAPSHWRTGAWQNVA